MKKRLVAALLAVVVLFIFCVPVSATSATTWDDVDDSAKTLGALYMQYVYWSMGGFEITTDEALQYMSDSMTAWLKWSDAVGWCLCPYDDLYYYVVDGELWCYEGSAEPSLGSGGRCRIDEGGGRGDCRGTVSGDTFNDIIARLNEQYSPKANSDTKIISWKDDPYWSANANNPDAAQLTVFFGSNLWCGQNWTSCYMVPFYYDGTTYYYGEYQYYWYFSEPVNVDGSNVIMTNCDVTSYITGESVTHADLFDRAVASYFDITVPGYWTNNVDTYVKGFATLNAIGGAKAVKQYPIDITHSRTFYNTVRDSVTMPLYTGSAVGFNAAPSSDVSENIGFICSSQPISLIFEWEQFPSDTYITIGGDNIYNYTISNPDTGESTTIYNYITNNYNFPASDNDDDNGGSGTAGGDVNVSGDITVSGGVDVGGQVDVNINVNVNDNGGSGSSGTTESQPSYIDGVNTNLTDYLDKTPEVADGFIVFLSDFFYWLPADLLGVIILGLVVAVWCRLAGR